MPSLNTKSPISAVFTSAVPPSDDMVYVIVCPACHVTSFNEYTSFWVFEPSTYVTSSDALEPKGCGIIIYDVFSAGEKFVAAPVKLQLPPMVSVPVVYNPFIVMLLIVPVRLASLTNFTVVRACAKVSDTPELAFVLSLSTALAVIRSI